jgi:hypothetical protein
MANTTNYNWETPDDTDLVKDGAAAIRTLGSSIDTTTKNLNPETTTGDIAYRSATANTNTRLAIGSTGQVLTVAGGVPSWATPTTGDIEGVTAGTGISGGGTSGTVTITNSMATAIDAKGDLVVGTGADTFTRLAVGTNDYVLTAASGEATGLKWAAAGAGALTKITSASFSAQSSLAVDGCFTATYTKYKVIYQCYSSAADADLQFQFRYAGPTTQTTDYYGSGNSYNRNNSTSTFNSNNTSQLTITDRMQNSAAESTTGAIEFALVGNASENPIIYGMGFNSFYTGWSFYSGVNNIARNYTGFLLKPDSGTITGSYAVYGYQN